MPLGLVIPAVVVVLLLGLALVFLIRASMLRSKPGSFPAYLMVDGKWVRGVGIYGRNNLEWRREASLQPEPELRIPRRRIDVVSEPSSWVGTGMVVLQMDADGERVILALAPGDASGLVSWIDSAPPRELTRD